VAARLVALPPIGDRESPGRALACRQGTGPKCHEILAKDRLSFSPRAEVRDRGPNRPARLNVTPSVAACQLSR